MRLVADLDLERGSLDVYLRQRLRRRLKAVGGRLHQGGPCRPGENCHCHKGNDPALGTLRASRVLVHADLGIIVSFPGGHLEASVR